MLLRQSSYAAVLTALPRRDFSIRIVKSVAPIVRIITIMLMTLVLIATYCDDLNPLDRLKAQVRLRWQS